MHCDTSPRFSLLLDQLSVIPVRYSKASAAPLRLGIVGGMGPLAGAQFFREFTSAYPAGSDQDHPIVCLLSDPTIPSRSAAILSGSKSAGESIRLRIEQVISWGAEVVAVPCNTAHFFIDEFRSELFDHTSVRLAHIVDATLAELRARNCRDAWLLGTEGTVKSRIYEHHSAGLEISLHLPPERMQQRVDECVDAVKCGDMVRAVGYATMIAEELAAVDDFPLVAACTELPLAFTSNLSKPIPHISSIGALVQETIRLVSEPRPRAARTTETIRNTPTTKK